MIISKISINHNELSPAWPFTLPAIRHIANEPLRLGSPVTILVGDNGAGKSTLIEAIAQAYGLDVRGGHGGRKYNNAPSKGALAKALALERDGQGNAKSRSQGFFLRAETAMGMLEYMSESGVAGYGGDRLLSEMSHGESFLEVVSGRFNEVGLYLLDEPESGLSFTSQLAFVDAIVRLASHGSQVICATHSPIIAGVPEAAIYEINDDDGLMKRDWKELGSVENWQSFLARPESFTRHLGQ